MYFTELRKLIFKIFDFFTPESNFYYEVKK